MPILRSLSEDQRYDSTTPPLPALYRPLLLSTCSTSTTSTLPPSSPLSTPSATVVFPPSHRLSKRFSDPLLHHYLSNRALPPTPHETNSKFRTLEPVHRANSFNVRSPNSPKTTRLPSSTLSVTFHQHTFSTGFGVGQPQVFTNPGTSLQYSTSREALQQRILHTNTVASKQSRNATLRVRTRKPRVVARRTVSVSAKPGLTKWQGFEVRAQGGVCERNATHQKTPRKLDWSISSKACETLKSEIVREQTNDGFRTRSYNPTSGDPWNDVQQGCGVSVVPLCGSSSQFEEEEDFNISKLDLRRSSSGGDTSGVESYRSDNINSDRSGGSTKQETIRNVQSTLCNASASGSDVSSPLSRVDSAISSESDQRDSSVKTILPRLLEGTANVHHQGNVRRHQSVNRRKSLPQNNTLGRGNNIVDLSGRSNRMNTMISVGTVFVKARDVDPRRLPLHRKHSSPANIAHCTSTLKPQPATITSFSADPSNPTLLTVSIRQQSCATSGSEAFFNLSLQSGHGQKQDHLTLQQLLPPPSHNKVSRSISCAAALARKQSIGNATPRHHLHDLPPHSNVNLSQQQSSSTKTINLVTNLPGCNVSSVAMTRKLAVGNNINNTFSVRRHPSVNDKQVFIDDWINDCHAQNTNYNLKQQVVDRNFHENEPGFHQVNSNSSLHAKTFNPTITLERNRTNLPHRRSSLANTTEWKSSEFHESDGKSGSIDASHHVHRVGDNSMGFRPKDDGFCAPRNRGVVRSKSTAYPHTATSRAMEPQPTQLYSRHMEAVNPHVLIDALNNHKNSNSNKEEVYGPNAESVDQDLMTGFSERHSEAENSPPRYTHTPTKSVIMHRGSNSAATCQQQRQREQHNRRLQQRRSLGSLLINPNADMSNANSDSNFKNGPLLCPQMSWQPHTDTSSIRSYPRPAVSSQPHRSQSLRNHSSHPSFMNSQHVLLSSDFSASTTDRHDQASNHLGLSSQVSTVSSYALQADNQMILEELDPRLGGVVPLSVPPALPPRPKHLLPVEALRNQGLRKAVTIDYWSGWCPSFCPRGVFGGANDNNSGNIDSGDVVFVGGGGCVVKNVISSSYDDFGGGENGGDLGKDVEGVGLGAAMPSKEDGVVGEEGVVTRLYKGALKSAVNCMLRKFFSSSGRTGLGGNGTLTNGVSPTDAAQKRVVRALYDYKAAQSGDLSLVQDEEYEVLEETEEHWWRLRDRHGNEGYSPSNYVKEATDVGLHQYDWYLGDATRQRAETILMREEREGCFVVRNSSSTSGMYTISVYCSLSRPQVKHYHIQKDSDSKYYLSHNIKCNSISELIYKHQYNPGGLCTRLRSAPHGNKPPATAGFSRDKWDIPLAEITLLEEIGSGQFGVVKRGRYRGLDVAVKMMKEGTMSEDEFIEEAKVMTKLQHPNLVQLYGVCKRQRPVYIITEFLEYGSLLHYLRQKEKALSSKTDTLIDMCLQISEGMAYLEKEKFIHRDLAARNCLVGSKNIKVGDFGLARYVVDDEYTGSGGAKFPIKWAAPEVLNYMRFSSKSDVWAFGVLMWEVFTCGKMPYGRRKNADVVAMVQEGAVLDKPRYCPHNVYQVMRECWEPVAEQRPSFNDLKTEIGRLNTDD